MKVSTLEGHRRTTRSVACVGLALATFLTVVPACRSTTAPTKKAVPSSVVRLDAATGRVLQVFEVGPDPLVLAVAGGAVWTLNLGDGSVSRIDPKGARRIEIREAVGIGSDGEGLWAALDGKQLVPVAANGSIGQSIDLAEEPIFASRNAGFVGVGHGSIWLTVPVLTDVTQPHTLWRVEIPSGRVLAKIPVGRDPLTPLVSDAVWMVHPSEARITRIDPANNGAVSIEAGSLPIAIASGAGAIWLAHESGDIYRLDADGRVVQTIEVEDVVRGITVSEEMVWLTTTSGVLGVDAVSGRVMKRFELIEPRKDKGPIGIGVLDDDLWISVE